ncbi:MAG: hypothetical protein G01um101444_194 [Parcubacteria group bacterium Gr01-1014_44]|nr:MAG: hypothetical protein G01um101444_194 [Parcubacteria group bacterium Gr01-1014_44]
MAKARIQLAILATLFTFSGYFLWTNFVHSHGINWQAPLLFLFTTFSATAISILVCTFIRAKQLPNGSVCFMSNHPLVRIGFVDSGGTTLCPTYWIIGIIITAISMIVLMVFSMLWYVVEAIGKENFWRGVVLPTLTIITFFGVLALATWLGQKKSWLWKIPIVTLCSLVVFLSAVLFLYLLPMAQIEKSYDMEFVDKETWIAGTTIYLKWLSVGMASLVLAATLIFLTFKHWKALADSWLGKQISLLKEKLCIRLVKCN